MIKKQSQLFILFLISLAVACENIVNSTGPDEQLVSGEPGEYSICSPISEAFKIQGSLLLPHVEDVPGGDNQDTLIAFLQSAADSFSWKSFIAMNWLANEDGSPDSTVCFGEKDGLTVWEHWMPSQRVLVPEGSSPAPWVSGIKSNGTPINFTDYSKLRLIAKPSHLDNISDLDSLNADDTPLIDQNGNLTLFEVFYNKSVYDYIVKGNLYNKKGQREFVKNWPDLTEGLKILINGKAINIAKEEQMAFFSFGNTIDSTFDRGNDTIYQYTINEGAILIKSAWRLLTAADNPAKFHTRKIEGNGDTLITLGLVGMHIMHKVAESPQWLWSTFEHIHNAPLLGTDGRPILEPGVDYLYFNESASDTTAFNKPPKRPIPSDPAQRTPTQVVRVRAIEAGTNKINQQFHQLLRNANPNSVWLNYRLTGTQWPFTPILFTDGKPYEPTLLANTVLETYNQNTSSCINCHYKARFLEAGNNGFSADFVYQLRNAPE